MVTNAQYTVIKSMCQNFKNETNIAAWFLGKSSTALSWRTSDSTRLSLFSIEKFATLVFVLEKTSTSWKYSPIVVIPNMLFTAAKLTHFTRDVPLELINNRYHDSTSNRVGINTRSSRSDGNIRWLFTISPCNTPQYRLAGALNHIYVAIRNKNTSRAQKADSDLFQNL